MRMLIALLAALALLFPPALGEAAAAPAAMAAMDGHCPESPGTEQAAIDCAIACATLPARVTEADLTAPAARCPVEAHPTPIRSGRAPAAASPPPRIG